MLYIATLVLVVCNGVAHAATAPTCDDVTNADTKCKTQAVQDLMAEIAAETDKDKKMTMKCDLVDKAYECFNNLLAKYYEVPLCDQKLKDIAFNLKISEYYDCGANTAVFTVWLLLVIPIVKALFN